MRNPQENLKRLWAPWRASYLVRAGKTASRGCVFCRVSRAGSDGKRFVLKRGERVFSLLNVFPYNNGHLMIVPTRHVGRLEELTAQEWLEIRQLAQDAMGRLHKTMAPDGYNLGVNIGRAAGAGIPGHFHLHLVPRWTGDTNFMPVLAYTKVISQSLESAYQLLREAPRTRGVRRAGQNRRFS